MSESERLINNYTETAGKNCPIQTSNQAITLIQGSYSEKNGQDTSRIRFFYGPLIILEFWNTKIQQGIYIFQLALL
jgi:hypothetical protein